MSDVKLLRSKMQIAVIDNSKKPFLEVTKRELFALSVLESLISKSEFHSFSDVDIESLVADSFSFADEMFWFGGTGASCTEFNAEMDELEAAELEESEENTHDQEHAGIEAALAAEQEDFTWLYEIAQQARNSIENAKRKKGKKK